MLPKLGRAAHRSLSPRCRNIAAKRQVAAEALQNVCALRSGARHLLAVGVTSARFPCRFVLLQVAVAISVACAHSHVTAASLHSSK